MPSCNEAEAARKMKSRARTHTYTQSGWKHKKRKSFPCYKEKLANLSIVEWSGFPVPSSVVDECEQQGRASTENGEEMNEQKMRKNWKSAKRTTGMLLNIK